MENRFMDLALLIVRIAVGVIFVAHGLQKTFGLFGGPGIEGVTSMVSGMGFQHPVVWAWVLSLTELISGIMLIFGIFPRLSALLIAIIMGVAIYKVHGPKGFFAMQGGFEYPFLILASSIALALAGAGKFSLFNRL